MTQIAGLSGRRWSAPAALALACLVAVSCTAPTVRTTFPPFGSTPAPAGDATAATRQQVIGALAAVGLQAVDATRPYRPFEGPLLAAAPRTVLQTLPDDALHGNVIIYALGSEAAAQAAAADHAAYLSLNTSKVNFPPGSRFVLQRVGSTVVFFTWSPEASPDPRLQSIAEVLVGLGTAVEIPS
jgi:hypothetical protein